jgi:hypothetical protein
LFDVCLLFLIRAGGAFPKFELYGGSKLVGSNARICQRKFFTKLMARVSPQIYSKIERWLSIHFRSRDEAEALGVRDRRKARGRCMFLTTAARHAACYFIARSISALRDAVLSFGSLFIGLAVLRRP